jgi:uncharacterized membrane protein YbhN (UPF0104 family)
MADAPDRAPAARTSPLRSTLPWLIAAGTLFYLVASIPFEKLKDALARAPLLEFTAFVMVYAIIGLGVDSFATWVTFRHAIKDIKLSFAQTIRIRGEAYLLSLIHYGIGQGAVAYMVHKRTGAHLARCAGTVMLTIGVNLVLVALCAMAGVLVGGAPSAPALRVIVYGLAAGFPIYLLVIALQPKFLAKRKILQPLFEAGVMGHLVAGAARIPHVLTLVAGHMGAMHLFGVETPIADGLALLPIVFVIGNLPITPSGLGTAQVTAVQLFSRWAPGITQLDREAVVFGYSIALQFLGLFAQAALGLVFLKSNRRPDTIKTDAPPSEPNAP